MGTLIDIKDLAKVYERGKQKVEVLHHVNLAIAEGDFLALMGPSGSGKTTLLNLIGGLDTPTAGSITVGGQRIDQLGGGALAKWRASNVGFIFQFYNLMPMLSAQRNVELPLLLTKLSGAQRRKNAAIALQLVGLAERGTHKPANCLADNSSVWRSRVRSCPIPPCWSATSRPVIWIVNRPRMYSVCCSSSIANTARPS
jgi:putative ABC transport system ATP-binding protein